MIHSYVFRALVSCVKTCFVDYRFKLCARASIHNSCNSFVVYTIYELFTLQIMLNDFLSVLAVRSFNLNCAVESACTVKGIREISNVIDGRKNEYVFAFYFINAGLNRYVFFRIGMSLVTVSELIHIVKIND